MILTDAGPLIAIVDRDDRDHARCIAVLSRLRPPLVTVWPTFTEAMHILGTLGGYTFQAELWALRADGLVALHQGTDAEADRAEALMAQYRDAPMDLGDAALVAAAEALSEPRIFTLDRHFHAYRPLHVAAFEVIP